MERIKQILHTFSFSRLLFSIIFSISLFFMNKVAFLGYVFHPNYMDKIFLSEFKILFLFIPITYLLLYLIENHYKKIIDIIITNKPFEHKKTFCITAFIFLLVIYLIYYFTFYPGGVYTDTWASFQMLTGVEKFDNKQPVLYTLMLFLVKAFLPDVSRGFGIFTFIQVILMVLTFTYFIYWLLNKKVNSIIATIITLFLGFFKLYPLYSVSVWKDTPFSLSVFLYTLTLIDLIIDFNNKEIKKSNIIKFNIFTILIAFLRTNGFISLFSLAILLVIYFKDIFINKKILHFKPFIISSIIVLLIINIIPNFYHKFGISPTSTIAKAISIPIQQVAMVVSEEGNITDDQKELIEKVIPFKNIKKSFRPTLADTIRWNSEFNEDYLQSHLNEYFKLWFELFIQNPKEYFIQYLLQTSGFWTFNVKGEEAFHSAEVWKTLTDTVESTDLIAEYSNFSFKADLLHLPFYSGGFFFWITAFSIFITFRICKKKYLLGYIPGILIWLSVMLSTPMASALRYVYILVLILPLNFVYPAIVKAL